MRILAIETSCDETAVAIVESRAARRRQRIRVLANFVSSQAALHSKFGGVVPNLAKREHQRNLVPVLLAALKGAKLRNPKSEIPNSKQIPNSKFKILNLILGREPELFARIRERVLPLKPPKIDAIAVTVGPGLAPALWVGVNFARSLSFLWGKPIIPVNHLEGHICTNLLPQIRERVANSVKRRDYNGTTRYPLTAIRFPALCLIVSGGHTELVLMKRYGSYQVIGETLDDAAGEAFDKVAKMMGLGFPGGPVISRLAERGDSAAFPFPRPMIQSPNFDFSFSGLKTAVLYTLRGIRRLTPAVKRDIAASFERAVVEVLVAKTMRAAARFKAKTVMIGGGVAANKHLRAELARALTKLSPIPHHLFPRISLTGDNALMIALAALLGRKKKKAWRTLQAVPRLRLDDRSALYPPMARLR